jgi:hypothetical protein
VVERPLLVLLIVEFWGFQDGRQFVYDVGRLAFDTPSFEQFCQVTNQRLIDLAIKVAFFGIRRGHALLSHVIFKHLRGLLRLLSYFRNWLGDRLELFASFCGQVVQYALWGQIGLQLHERFLDGLAIQATDVGIARWSGRLPVAVGRLAFRRLGPNFLHGLVLSFLLIFVKLILSATLFVDVTSLLIFVVNWLGGRILNI